MHRTVIVGSPRKDGRSAHLAEEIFDACIEDCPEDSISVLSISTLDIAPCIGCDVCKDIHKENTASDLDAESADGVQSDALPSCELVSMSDAASHQCFMKDDMCAIREHINAASELIVVSPVYFSGAPSQFKALMDRLQPYYWSNLYTYTKTRRPLTLHIVGEAGNPNPPDPLVGTVKSAFAVAGFRLEEVFDWTGCLDADGTILKEAKEIALNG